MKLLGIAFWFVLALAPCPTAFAQAQVRTSATLTSRYTWRGYEPAAHPSIQPNVGFTAGGFNAALWASGSLVNRATTGTADEIDLIAGWTAPLKHVTATAGTIVYAWPHQAAFSVRDHVTAEVFVGATLDVPLQPSITAYYDFLLGQGFYAEANAAYPFHVGALGLGATWALGYDAGQLGVAPAFSHTALGLQTEVHLAHLTLQPALSYLWTFRTGARDGLSGSLTFVW